MKKTNNIIIIIIIITLISAIAIPTYVYLNAINSINKNENNIDYIEGYVANATMENVNFSKEIGDDGSVGYDYPSYVGDITYFNWTKTYNLTITNNKSGGVFIDIYFQHPNQTIRKQGLHDWLETESLSVYSQSAYWTTNGFAFYGADYRERWDYDTWRWRDGDGLYNKQGCPYKILDENETVNIPITFKLSSCPSGTFYDGLLFPCSFWIVDRNLVQEVTFWVIT